MIKKDSPNKLMKNKLIFLFLLFFINNELKSNENNNRLISARNPQEEKFKNDVKNLRNVRTDLNSLQSNNAANYNLIPGFGKFSNSQKKEFRSFSQYDWEHKYEKCALLNCGINLSISSWPADQRKVLFRNYNHYEFSGYVAMLKSFPEYGEMIGEINNLICNDKKLEKKIVDLKIKVDGKCLCKFINEEAHKYIQKIQENKFQEKKKKLIEACKKEIEDKNLNYPTKSLTETLNDNVEIHHKNNNLDLANYYHRIRKAVELTKSDNRIIDKIYSLNPNAKDLFKRNSIDANKYLSFKGNFAQQQLHNELVDIANKTAELHQKNSHYQEFDDFVDSMLNFIDTGYLLNKAGQFANACSIGEIVHCSYGFARGVFNACADNAKFIKNAFLHPLETKDKLYIAAKNLTFSLAKGFLTFLAYCPDYSPESEFSFTYEEFERHHKNSVIFQSKVNKILKSACEYADHYWNQVPREQKFQHAGYFVADSIIGSYTGKKVKQFACFTKNMMKGFSKESSKLIGLACKEGVPAVQEGIEILQQYPQIMKPRETILTGIERSIEYAKAREVYIDNVCKTIKEAANNKEFSKLFKECGVTKPFPISFVPSHSLWPSKTLDFFTDSKNITYILDKAGNSWRYTNAAWEVICSEVGSKHLALFNKGIAPKILTINQTKNLLGLPNKALVHLFDVQVDINKFAKKYTNFKHIIEEVKGLPITVDFEHILSFEPKALIKRKLKGFHHDVNNYIEKNSCDFLKFTNKEINKQGILKTNLVFNGKTYREKTFFPSYWSREKVINKILESTKNIISKNIDKQQIIQLNALTKEGIEIEMFIDKHGKITTAYPIFKS